MIFHLTFFCSLVSILKVITAVNYNSTTVISTPINIIEAIYDARAANYDAGVVIQHCHFLPKLWYRSSNYGPSIIISGLASQFRVLYFYKNGPLVNRSNFFLPWLRAGLFLRRKVFRFPSIGRKTAVKVVKVDESVFLRLLIDLWTFWFVLSPIGPREKKWGKMIITGLSSFWGSELSGFQATFNNKCWPKETRY